MSDVEARIARGMAAQAELRRRRLDAGETLLGWKVAFGAPAAMQRLGTTRPIVGFLASGALLESGATLALGDFTKLVVEPEIAVHLGRDLGAGATHEEARAAIAALAPAIEIADLAFPPDDVERILATDIYQRHIVLGEPDATRAGARLDGLRAHVARASGALAETDDVEANTGALVDLVRLVADTLAAGGDRLEAGQIVIAGSVVPPLFVETPDTVTWTLAPFPPISVAVGG